MEPMDFWHKTFLPLEDQARLHQQDDSLQYDSVLETKTIEATLTPTSFYLCPGENAIANIRITGGVGRVELAQVGGSTCGGDNIISVFYNTTDFADNGRCIPYPIKLTTDAKLSITFDVVSYKAAKDVYTFPLRHHVRQTLPIQPHQTETELFLDSIIGGITCTFAQPVRAVQLCLDKNEQKLVSFQNQTGVATEWYLDLKGKEINMSRVGSVFLLFENSMQNSVSVDVLSHNTACIMFGEHRKIGLMYHARLG